MLEVVKLEQEVCSTKHLPTVLNDRAYNRQKVDENLSILTSIYETENHSHIILCNEQTGERHLVFLDSRLLNQIVAHI